MKEPTLFAIFTLLCFTLLCFAILVGGMIKVDQAMPKQSSTFKRLKDAGCYDEHLNFQATDMCCELAPWFKGEDL